jgi:monofunctional glycosyltransferase
MCGNGQSRIRSAAAQVVRRFRYGKAIGEPENARLARAAGKNELQTGRGAFRGFRGRLFGLLILLAMAPLVVGLIYGFKSVHPVSTTMIWRWLTGAQVDRQWVDLDAVASVMRNSVIMSEDGQFCTHRGIDWDELNAVIDDARGGERTRGASTLTMQTAKNLFLWNGRSYVRKALELPLAIYLDGIWPKSRVLEVYLNIAEWGDGIFGVEAAARHYFGRPAARLTARQAALLTVTLPNPLERDPAQPSRGLNRLANTIQARASNAGGYVGCVN